LKTPNDGNVLGFDTLSLSNIATLAECFKTADLAFIDDIFGRNVITTLATCFNVPCIVTSHTDFSKISFVKDSLIKRLLFSANSVFPTEVVHATTTKIYAKQIGVSHIWPIMIWSDDFKSPVSSREIKDQRQIWTNRKLEDCVLFDQDVNYDGICLYAGRLSIEKRIELIIRNIPHNLLLVIIGDNDTNDTYVKQLIALSKSTHNVLIQRGMVNSKMLNLYYRSCDMFVSASNFETCGNCVVEALVAGACVAIQPEQGHLEHVVHRENGYFIDFNNVDAKQQLTNSFNSRNNLTHLKETSLALINHNFGQVLHDNLINPALAIQAPFYKQLYFLLIMMFFFALQPARYIVIHIWNIKRVYMFLSSKME
jgi:glycosyltransferase involved in cell wall biosynthesis